MCILLCLQYEHLIVGLQFTSTITVHKNKSNVALQYCNKMITILREEVDQERGVRDKLHREKESDIDKGQ